MKRKISYQKFVRLLCILFAVVLHLQVHAQQHPRFRALVIAEPGGIHLPFVDTAKIWLNKLAADSSFAIDYIDHTEMINEEYLSHYAVFIQLNFPPYMWPDSSKAAFEKYIQQGKGGWIGFHHSTLLGEFDGYQMWNWFSDFMGGIRWKNYIATFAKATVNVEEPRHAVMKNVPGSFSVEKEEWYTWNKNPRPNVHVLASVDENSYEPQSEIKMGDHPVIWSNDRMKARNIYIFMGHHPSLFQNQAFTTIFRNSVFWAASK